jgi:phenylacetate-CoA ligase
MYRHKEKEMYTWLVSHIVFPLHESLKKHNSVLLRKELENTQWLTNDELRELQRKKLQRFLKTIGTNVPYYARIFEELRIDLSHKDTFQELRRLPFLTKEIIRKNTPDLKSKYAKQLVRFNTGGSSGQPLVFFVGLDRVSHDVAAKWRATRWWDVDIGDREIVVWGSPIELGTQDKIRAIRDKVLRSRLLSAFEMSDQKVQEFIDTIRTFRPKMLFGYPSALAYIAKHAEAEGVQLNNIGLKVAFVTSEVLYDTQRQQIERTFGCPVANGYGGRDAGFIAHQCPAGGMHISAEDIIVEIVDESGRSVEPGISGEIVVTHLATGDFPFVRYKTGDIGVVDDAKCECGRGLPLLKEIAGRSTDFLVTTDGTVMHGLGLIYVLRELQGIEEFKIVQESKLLTRVLVVVDDSFQSESMSKIKREFKARLGQEVNIEIALVSKIPREASGKYRYVVSKISGNQ